MFEPRFSITGKMARHLMRLEADRDAVASLPLTASLLNSLRRTARLLSTHYSTQIEGNQLSQSQVAAVIEGEGNFPGRERDEAEVRNYFAALTYVESISQRNAVLTEREVRTIHGLVISGRQKASAWRKQQNVVRDARTGGIIYLPPEPGDVPGLMKELVQWVNISLEEAELPVPVIVAIAHYQFATIHPYLDGNGRTARLLCSLLLRRNGYGLKGIYSLEEYYSESLSDYYNNLAIGSSHNYYFGRAEADITPFVSYFVEGMAAAFGNVRKKAETFSRRHASDQAVSLRDLTPQQRQALGLFAHRAHVSRNEIAAFFKLPERRAYLLCNRWVKCGFLVAVGTAKKNRRYHLAEQYQHLFEEI